MKSGKHLTATTFHPRTISHILRCRSHTFLRPREDVEIFSCCSTAQSMEGTASFLSHLLERNEDVSPRFRSACCSKHDESKCTEQSTDVFDGCHFALCHWTKLIHFSRIASSRGNICRELHTVFGVISTTHISGASCNARRPCLWFLVYSELNIYTTSDVTWLFWPCKNGGQFLV